MLYLKLEDQVRFPSGAAAHAAVGYFPSSLYHLRRHLGPRGPILSSKLGLEDTTSLASLAIFS